MKHEFNGITANVAPGDFGAMGNWFTDLFSSKTFTKAQNVTAGNAWLSRVFNELRPNVTYSKFIEALKLDNYNQPIPEEDFQDFVETLGFNVNTSPSIADKVRTSLVKSLSANKNMLPSRKSIMSAFLNPDVVRWTYWDAVKMTSSQAAKTASNVASGVAEVASAAVGTAGFIFKYKWHLLGAVALAGGYFLYQNRDVVKQRLNERGLKAMGLGK